MKRDQLANRVDALNQKAQADILLAQRIDERAQQLSQSSKKSLGSKAVRAAHEALELAEALMGAEPSETLGDVETNSAWNNVRRSRYIRLDQLGVYHLDQDRNRCKYSLTLSNTDPAHPGLRTNFPYNILDSLATISTVPEMADHAVTPHKVATLQENLETLRVIHTAAGIETPSVQAA